MNNLLQRHFLQSNEWAHFQKALGHHVIERSGEGWQYVAIIETGDGFIGSRFRRLYCPYGPYYTSQDALKDALEDLEKQAAVNAVDYVRIEPTTNGDCSLFKGGDYGYAHQKHDLQPHQTLLIDLRPSFDEILQGMSKTNRYFWNRCKKGYLHFKTSYKTADLEAFLEMMNDTANRAQITFRQSQYYETLLEVLGPKKNMGVAYAYHEQDVLVGVLFADDFEAKTRYYIYAGSFDKARKFSANSPLVSYLLHEARQIGLETFDFFGVSPEDATDHRWAGFSKFKRSFGGSEFAYAGTWEKPIKKGRYNVMAFARKFA